ncbi:MAG: Crp/Fnr family transcriptional regulator [Sulfurovum sp.]|nr:Crp/Fnr family transcriptional regulator [Sulfurovum sp.]
MKDLLKESTLFSALEEVDLIALEKIASVCSYHEGETLFVAGEVSTVLMLLVEGVVSIFKHDDKGNEIVIGYFSRDALLAEPATLRHSPLPSSARFVTQGKLLKIELRAFEKTFLHSPNISHAIIQSLLKKIELLQQNIHFNIATSAKEKILQFYTKNPTLSVDLKQYEIASVLGMTAETFSRNISKLIKEKKLLKVRMGYKVIK